MIKLLISWSEHNKLTDTVIFSRFGFNSIFQMFACNQLRNSNLRTVLFTQQLLQIFLLNHTNLGVDLFIGSLSVTWGTEWSRKKKKISKMLFWLFTQFGFYYIIVPFFKSFFSWISKFSFLHQSVNFAIEFNLKGHFFFSVSFLIGMYWKKTAE